MSAIYQIPGDSNSIICCDGGHELMDAHGRVFARLPTPKPVSTPAPKRTAPAFDEATIKNLVQRAMRKEIITMSRSSRHRHAHDAEGRDLDSAYKHMYKAMDHLYDARDGKMEFDEGEFSGHLKNCLECLKVGGEDELLDDDEREQDSQKARDNEGGETTPPRPLLSGSGRSADIGQTAARSTSTLNGVAGRRGHQKDFNSIAEGGADSAHGYDAATLLGGERDGGKDFAAYWNAWKNRNKPKPAKRKAGSTPAAHAHDTRGDAGYDLDAILHND